MTWLSIFGHGHRRFGKHVAIELDSESGEQLLVPSGFAHGFCTLQPRTVVFYKVDQVYAPSHDGGVYWADPALAIDWPVTASKGKRQADAV